MACENVMAGTDAIRRMVLAPIAAWKVSIVSEFPYISKVIS